MASVDVPHIYTQLEHSLHTHIYKTHGHRATHDRAGTQQDQMNGRKNVGIIASIYIVMK